MKVQFTFAIFYMIQLFASHAFNVGPRHSMQHKSLLNANPIKGFFDELDNFMDDAFSRRLGNGAAFYGKRKSSFYGNDDKMKKVNAKTPDPSEDYQGPSSASMFVWMQDEETGEMKPVTRMRNRNVERNMKFWDKVYAKDEE